MHRPRTLALIAAAGTLGGSLALAPSAASALDPVDSALLGDKEDILVPIERIDPDVIVLGGGVSNYEHLYREVPDLMAPWIFGDAKKVNLVRAKHGDSSGVFGAARLWDKG